MRKALILIILLSLVSCIGAIACSNGIPTGDNDFLGTDPIVKEFRIGSKTIVNGGMFSLDFANIDNFSFDLNSSVDPITFETFLDIKIVLYNVDRNQYFVLTKPSMLENGYFDIYNDGKSVEYRMRHTMDRLWVGGTPQDFVSPGQTIMVTVDYVSGRDAEGDWFAYRFDSFKLIYSTTEY